MNPHVPNEALLPSMIPDSDGELADILVFAHSFHAYKVAGSVTRVAGLATDSFDAYMATGALPTELTTLRTVLFATARAHDGQGLGDDAQRYLRALVAAIAETAAGGDA